MEDNLNRFLCESPLAEKIKLPSRVAIHRTKLSPHEINGIKTMGVYGPVPAEEEICELEIGGRRIALGKITKKRGGRFFKVLHLLDETEAKEEGR